ncbi:class I SAM-dependent methyltransferase [Roseiarcaceae bacterium H3SJ34-1]|uniref:class I SAM-dependent methyltransferase n=1 Tax=Terripilifer ovatus TaxID=3032367 RepID=UPI003AB92ADD|nr:class I SAM-dependent methyltransferase [Roseiarcaceae bacterium H3SJ34-1]
MNYLTSIFFGVRDNSEFLRGVQHAINNIGSQDGIYSGDNLFTFGRNLGFLEDKKLLKSFKRHSETPIERAILWRVAVAVWGALNGVRLAEGDFVECACYKGMLARIICDYVDFAARLDRHYYLYDLFDHEPGLAHHSMPEHGKDLYDRVKQRFSDTPNVTVTRGSVPDVLSEVAPQKIAFMHIDLNNARAEIGALEILFDRLVPGAVMILDDYGWKAYRAQKQAEDPWLARRGYHVLELPTGQGLVIK